MVASESVFYGYEYKGAFLYITFAIVSLTLLLQLLLIKLYFICREYFYRKLGCQKRIKKQDIEYLITRHRIFNK